MCGRFTITTDPNELAKRFGITIGDVPYAPRFNAAPTQALPAILNETRGQLAMLRWGLIPSWAKDPAIGNRMINARAETLLEKPSFRTALKKRRCLVPADGFYEWKKLAKTKLPMRIVLRSGEPFAFAGLWETWRNPAGETLRTFTIITTEPNELMAPIHNRMPAILSPQAESVWLDDAVDPKSLVELLRPYPAGEMRAYPVSRRVNLPRNDDPALIAPTTDDGALF